VIVIATHCCQSKSPLPEGTIRELYVDAPTQHRLEAFWKVVDEFPEIFQPAIISNLHGIILDVERFKNYDLSLKEVDGNGRIILGRRIHEKLPPNAEIIYYAYPPINAAAYCQILGYSGVPFHFFTRNGQVRAFLLHILENQHCPKCRGTLDHLGQGCFACWDCEKDYQLQKGVLKLREMPLLFQEDE
jgi:hypothetical protein